ncbi:MAG: hypothetical protein LBG20_01080 [Holosporaceae bacterium]|jgi:hypothetical protein|nr:hypothetical protein [Holosporaceae bacterium]
MKYLTVLGAIVFVVSAVDEARAMDLSHREAAQLAEGIDSAVKVVCREIKDARIADATRVLVVGATGGGKSTLVHLLAGIPLIVRKDAQLGDFSLEPQRMLFAVAPGPNSVTTVPGFWSDQNGIVYCDCPGFKDTRGPNQEIINAFTVDQLFTEPSKIKVLLVAEAAEVMADRSGGVKEQLHRLMQLIPDIRQLQAGVAIVITKIMDRRSPAQYLGRAISSISSSDDFVNGLLRFFVANPSSLFGFSLPLDDDLGTHYGARDRSIGATRDGIRSFLNANPLINPPHRISLNEPSLLLLSVAVNEFCNVRFSLQEFANLTAVHYRRESDIDKLRAWLSAIVVLMGNRGANDTPGALVCQIRSTAPFSQPGILSAFSGVLEKIDGFQCLQHFLQQVLKIGNLEAGPRQIFLAEDESRIGSRAEFRYTSK